MLGVSCVTRNCTPWFEVVVLVSQEFELALVTASDMVNEPVAAMANNGKART